MTEELKSAESDDRHTPPRHAWLENATKPIPAPGLDGLVFLCAFLFFLFTLYRDVWPGESARLLVAAGALDPFPILGHPLYSALARWVAAAAPHRFVGIMHVFSALCAAASVALLGWLARDLTLPGPKRGDEQNARRTAGVLASVFLAFSFPFWFAATRASVETWSMFLLLAAAHQWRTLVRRGHARHAFSFALVYGIGLVEHPVFLYAAPVFGIAMAYALFFRWLARQELPVSQRPPLVNKPVVLSSLLLATLAGAVSLGLHAVWYRRQPAFRWRELDGIGAVLRHMGGHWVSLFQGGLPRVGWLLIVVTLVVPALYLLLVLSLRPRPSRNTYGPIVLNVTLLAVSLLVFSLDAWAPRFAAGLIAPRILPSVTLALALGLLVAWVRQATRKGRYRPYVRVFGYIRQGIHVSCVPIGIAVGVAVAGFHGRMLYRAHQQPLTALARDAVDQVEPTDWLVVDDVYHDTVRLLDPARSASGRILAWHRSGMTPYRLHLSETVDVPDSDLALVGVQPLIAALFESSVETGERIGAIGVFEPWLPRGAVSEIRGPLVVAVKADNADVNGALRLAETNVDFAHAVERRNKRSAGAPGVDLWRSLAAIKAGRAANEAGVVFQETGVSDRAKAAYETALRVHPDNPIALLNRIRLAESKGESVPESDRKRLDARLAFWRDREMSPRVLAHVFGAPYVPHEALRLWRDSVSYDTADFLAVPGPDGGTLPAEGFEERKADARLAQREQQLRARVAEDPSRVDAWRGLFHLALLAGDAERAAERLERAEAAGLSPPDVAVERARLDRLRGDHDQARDRLREAVLLHPRNADAWILMAELTTGDDAASAETRERAWEMLDQLQPNLSPQQLLAAGRLSVEHGRFDRAEAALHRVLRIEPGNAAAMEWLLILGTRRGDVEAAHQWIHTLLAQDPGHATANFLLGSIRISREEWGEAEKALRRSLARRREVPALNDLAYVLAHEGLRLEEAEQLAREAVEKDPDFVQAWTTLARIFLSQGRLDEAEKASRRALALDPGRETATRILAEIREQQGIRSKDL